MDFLNQIMMKLNLLCKHYILYLLSFDPPLRDEFVRTIDPGVAGAHGLMTQYVGGARLTSVHV